MSWYKLGLSPEEIADEFGHLTLAQVYGALAYYHANREEVVEVVDFIDFLITRQPERHPLLQLMSETPGPEVELRELRQRLTAIPGNMSDTVREIRNERGEKRSFRRANSRFGESLSILDWTDEDGIRLTGVTLDSDTLQTADCVVITAAHSSYDWQRVAEHSRLIVDTRNATQGMDAASAQSMKL